MSLEWEEIVVDARDPYALGHWWREALGWVVVHDSADEVAIRPAPDRLPGILFGRSEDPKSVKNRLHFDFRPLDRDAEVQRLIELGATHADIGQSGDEPWVVLQDPEGNEFCVLRSRQT